MAPSVRRPSIVTPTGRRYIGARRDHFEGYAPYFGTEDVKGLEGNQTRDETADENEDRRMS